jgi:nucleoside phosphorylase
MIEAKIMTNTNPTPPEQADVLLVTATDVETQAVITLFERELDRRREPRFVGNYVYHQLGEVGGARVAHVQTPKMGGQAALLTVVAGIQALAPAAVIMVGIAFGADSTKQQIGEILVSQQLQDYDLVKVGAAVGAAVITPRGDRVSPSNRLLSIVHSAMIGWRRPKVDFGLVLSGSSLVDNQDYRDQLLHTFGREAIGGEMEGVGLYSAAKEHRVDWILIKAICDWADGHKAQDKARRQRTAAGNAARFVLHILRQGGFAAGHRPSQVRAAPAAPAGGISIGGSVGTVQSIDVSGGTVGSIIGSQTNVGAAGIDAAERAHLVDLREKHRRRLWGLEAQEAQLGVHTDPHISNEIKELREKIAEIERKLAGSYRE